MPVAMRYDEDKLTANYVSTIARAGLGAQLKQELMEFKLQHGPHVAVTNAKRVECIRKVLATAEAAANKLSGADASALISGTHDSGFVGTSLHEFWFSG